MCSSRRATVLALTLIPKSASARATLAVVRRDHFTPVMGSPAVSYSSRYSIRVTMSAVFFHGEAAAARAADPLRRDIVIEQLLATTRDRMRIHVEKCRQDG